MIAGAPAADWPLRLTNFAAIQAALRATPGGWIAPDRIAALAGVARASCLIAGDCTIRALRHTCRTGRKPMCLTAPQEASLRAIELAGYPLRDADPAEWGRWIVNPDPAAPSQLTLAEQGFRYVLADNPAWKNGDAPAMRADRAALFALGDLRAFAAKGGKLISYFGTADAVLPPSFAAPDARRMGADASFYRLFMVPGMAHCQGGMGPLAFGQSISAPSLADDSAHDIRRALEAWVERGRPPNTIFAATIGTSTPRIARIFPVNVRRRLR